MNNQKFNKEKVLKKGDIVHISLDREKAQYTHEIMKARYWVILAGEDSPIFELTGMYLVAPITTNPSDRNETSVFVQTNHKNGFTQISGNVLLNQVTTADLYKRTWLNKTSVREDVISGTLSLQVVNYLTKNLSGLLDL